MMKVCEDMARGNHLECGYCPAQRRTIHDLLIHVEVWHKEKAPIARGPVADRLFDDAAPDGAR